MKKLQFLLATALIAVSMNASAVSFADANCRMLVSHFDVSPDWSTGLVVQNLSDAQEVTIKSYANDPQLDQGGDLDTNASASIDIQFNQAEKKAFALALANPTSNPNILATGETTGWLFVLSNEPVTGFVIFGREAFTDSAAGIGPLQSRIEGNCDLN